MSPTAQPILSLTEFVWIWDEISGLHLPRHHKRMCRFLEKCWQAEEKNALMMAFRNSGKSTLVGLFGAWILWQNPECRLLILSADHSLAKKMATHMKRIIETHPLTHLLKPTKSEEWASDRFTVVRRSGFRDPSVLARGLMANMTGCRADVIICDDVEVPKTCDTSHKRIELRRKLSELDYILTPGGMTLYVGTPHTYETIYDTSSSGFLKHWPVLKIPLLTQNGQSAWPERFDLAKIQALEKRSGPTKFASQMMLQAIPPESSRLEAQRLRFYSDELCYTEANNTAVLKLAGHRLCGAACWWDPAFGALNGDKSVIACVFFDETGNAFIHRLLYMTVPPAQEATAYQCQTVATFVRDLFLPAVHLETNGIGKFLPALLRQELARSGIACAVIEETARSHKNTRILAALEPPLMNGALFVHESVKKTPFLTELRDFNPANTHTHDDGLDAVAGCLTVEPIRLGQRPPYPQRRLDWRRI